MTSERAQIGITRVVDVDNPAEVRRALIEDKRIGKILQIQGIIAQRGPYIGWDANSDCYFDQRSGGLFYDLGSHLLDLLLYVTDFDVESVGVTARISVPGMLWLRTQRESK